MCLIICIVILFNKIFGSFELLASAENNTYPLLTGSSNPCSYSKVFKSSESVAYIPVLTVSTADCRADRGEKACRRMGLSVQYPNCSL